MVALRMRAKRILCLLVAAFFVVSLTARPARGEEHASSVRLPDVDAPSNLRVVQENEAVG